LLGWPVFFYKNSGETWIVVLGSLAWAFAMVGLTSLLVKTGIKLKL
jgi:hypothetical protein